MATPTTPAVTNRTQDERRGMTGRELVTFMGDIMRAPIPVDLDQPLVVSVSLTGRLRSIAAPLVPCTCPKWPGTRTPLHHPSCAHRVQAAS